MTGEQKATVDDIGKSDGVGRQRSTISFPYDDLAAAIELAAAIHNNVGTGECDDDQLSAWTNQSSKSSGFRTQVYAARMFGLLAGEGGKHSLIDLGRKIVDPTQARAAKVQAFLSVPLYKSVYEHYKGGIIPPAGAFERDIVGMGVSEKQKDRARQVFERSAEQAGFFEHGRNRLIAPGVQRGQPDPEPETGAGGNGGGGGGGGSGGGGDGGVTVKVDPIIQGLLIRLPKSGDVWAEADRKLWLELLSGSFRLIYKDKEKSGE